ncbi:type I-C CRISPR-associated endonuclease Cas1c [Dehalogenimonas sp. THU2]|uniref:type I-C CRISPR-associated endonuclease Cas1c n=1 Tax=Dehalogenimonas sp. THU2 TaxID=3151121 RepID=UPI00321823AC
MKKLLNTLYVMTSGSYLSRQGETVVVRQDDEIKLQLPIHTLSAIMCFGQVSASAPLLGFCAARKVTVSFFSMSGRFMARMVGPVSGNVLLRKAQYRRADDQAFTADIARSFILAKIANCRTVLLRASRERIGDTVLAGAADDLKTHLLNLSEPIALDRIRGKEGDAARTYFSVFDRLITSQKEAFVFHERSRRPPLDNINALLSFVYTLLAHDVASALEGVGLDPAVGFLHRDRPGRPGLALDIMEELRPFTADRLVLSLINLRQIKAEGFEKTASGAVQMNDATRKIVLTEYQKKKQEEIRHPFLNEKVVVGLLPHIQAMLLARYLRGDLDGYPAFIFR